MVFKKFSGIKLEVILNELLYFKKVNYLLIYILWYVKWLIINYEIRCILEINMSLLKC